MKKQHFLIIVFIYIIAVFYLASTTPISPHEAKMLYSSKEVSAVLMRWSIEAVDGFLGLRLFPIFFGVLSIGLFYRVSRLYLDKKEDVYLATLIFMSLPGIFTAMILANEAIVVLPIVLLFVLWYEKGYFKALIPLMIGLFFVHQASVIFFAALFIYALMHKDKKLAIVSASFLTAFLFLAKGIAIEGKPSGHFMEIFGLYAAVFSPLLFLYFFYVMYRILLRERKTLLWYISFTALAFSLLLSIRQRVSITDFAPYVMSAVVLMLHVYNNSVRVRLFQFQKYYRFGFYAVMILLIVNVLLIVFHRALFYVMDDPAKHFAYRIYKPYLLAQELKRQKVNCYDSKSQSESYQLKYYGISSCSKN
ncbi:MAG: hypothetical protein PHR75_02215 [Sulfurovum sp.]|nr:hypothetical protein [Sulfurovum sp.]MDD3603422.1 hypothetical protein [Sulfurovum sp.]